jgi:GNAT superfamily N-acetyltransferase
LSTDRGSAPDVEPVDGDDWAQLRAVRLAALADAPSAFGSTLDREQEYDEERWREWSLNMATFLAFREGVPVGIVGGVASDTSDERTMVAMWVHPDHRRTGVASVLLDTVRNWARDDGATRMTLWVTRTNKPAAALYRRAGFKPTGDSKPLPSNPSLAEDKLALALR